MQLRKLLHTLSCALALVLTTACDPPDDLDMPPGAGTRPFSDAPGGPDDDAVPLPHNPEKYLTNRPVDANAIDDDEDDDELHPDDLGDVPHEPDDHSPEDLLVAPHSPTDPPAPSHPEDLTDR